ncbi:hypothetical protein BH18ACT12_BH18ACT12_14570 [soil metagenome]
MQISASSMSAPPQVTVPGNLPLRVAVRGSAREGDVSGFIVLSRGNDRRRIPFWFRVVRPQLTRVPHVTLARPGIYRGSTARGVSRVTSYRYPEVVGSGFPVRLPGREIAYRVRVRRPANFGVAIVAQDARVRIEPRIVRAGNENRLAGLTALPLDLNPYRSSYGRHRLIAGVVLPAQGLYDIVFDTPRNGRPGAFSFRYWVGDTTPPSARVVGVRGGFLELAVSDRGSGVDPLSLRATIDGASTPVTYSAGRARISVAPVARGQHTLTFSVADYQETKNMENVPGITPNTRTLRASFSR